MTGGSPVTDETVAELKGRFIQAFPCICHAGFKAREIVNPECPIHPILQIMQEVFGDG